MTVQSTEIGKTTTPPARKRIDWPIFIGQIGAWLTIVSFGGIFWAINGGFSVLGLEVVASSFNNAGALFWASLSSWTFAVPVTVPGLPTAQPVIPWIGVVAATMVQVSVVIMRLQGRMPPLWMIALALLLSLYDLGTTFFGLGTVGWLKQVGWPVQGLFALVLTFMVEITAGYTINGLLKRR